MNANKAKPAASPKAEARVYSFFLAWSYLFLVAFGALAAGSLLAGIIARDYLRAAVGAFFCLSFYHFIRRPGRIVRRQL